MEEQYTWQSGTGDGTVLLGLEMTKSNTEEALSTEDTVKCEDARCMRESPSIQTVRPCYETLVPRDNSQTSTQCIRNDVPTLQFEMPNRFEILGVAQKLTAAGSNRIATENHSQT